MVSQKPKIKIEKHSVDCLRYRLGCRKYHLSKQWFVLENLPDFCWKMEIYCKRTDAEKVLRHLREEVKKSAREEEARG